MTGVKEIWSKDDVRPRFYVKTGSMYENPYGVPVREIQEMEETLAPEFVAQAVYGMYVEDSGLVFSQPLVQNLLYGEALRVEKWSHPDYPIRFGKGAYQNLSGGGRKHFIAAADLARKNDSTVVMVFDATHVPQAPAQMVHYERLSRVTWDSIYASIARVSAAFQVEVLLDSTGMGGDVVLDELDGRFYCPRCHAAVPFMLTNGSHKCPKCEKEGHDIAVAGYNFSGRQKEQLITNLQAALSYGTSVAEESGLLRMPRIEQVLDELTFYRLDDKGLETDTVMALGLIGIQLDFEEIGTSLGSVHEDAWDAETAVAWD